MTVRPMTLLVNGERRAARSANPRRGARRARLRRRDGRDRAERRLRARAGSRDDDARRRRPDRDRRAASGRMKPWISTASKSPRACCSAPSQYPSPAILADAVRASGARHRHGVAAARIGAAARGAGFLAADPRARRPRAAQYRRLPQRQGGGDDGADGARGVRHALDQARGDRRGRHAAARRVRPRRGGAHPRRRWLSRCSLTRPRISSSPSGSSRRAARC